MDGNLARDRYKHMDDIRGAGNAYHSFNASARADAWDGVAKYLFIGIVLTLVSCILFILLSFYSVGFALIACSILLALMLWLSLQKSDALSRKAYVKMIRNRVDISDDDARWNLDTYKGRKYLCVDVQSRHRPDITYEWESVVDDGWDGRIKVSHPKLTGVNDGRVPSDVARWCDRKLNMGVEVAPDGFEQACETIVMSCNRATQASEKMVVAEETDVTDKKRREDERSRIYSEMFKEDDVDSR